MCDQTEIRYLDGDVVWVKLGPCWWPGQVTGVDNLPEDLKVDFNKKPLIAAVKFFQENSYEFVKNIHQIYQYNCTQKDDFIKKGLDKYRSKHKSGSKLMDKFPGDVETAEMLTGGDPNILKSEKFCPEEKPDISALFGEKKSPKKKQKFKDDEMTRRSYPIEHKIIRPRIMKESDHEVRIRQQPSSHPTTPTSSDQNMYACPLCSFTTTRVNVLICHNKSHREGSVDTGVRSLLSTPKRRSLGDEPQKRKYVRKNKSLPRLKTDRGSEPVKRKQKQPEKIAKKKKADPEINDLLADWDDGSDDMEVDMNKSTPISSPLTKERKPEEEDEDTDLLKESEKLLKETESLSTHLENSKTKSLVDPLFDEEILKTELQNTLEDESRQEEETIKSSISKPLNDSVVKEVSLSPVVKDKPKNKTTPEEDLKESENMSTQLTNSKAQPLENDSQHVPGLSLPVVKEKSALSKKLRKSLGDRKNSTPENDQEKKSKLSCFDFDDEEPEPALPPVRKIPRVFGEKNTSLKKEIIKEFVLSQALAEEKEAESKANEKEAQSEKIVIEEAKKMEDDEKLRQDILKTVDEASELVAKIASETEKSNEGKCKRDVTETELEIVEILEVERDKESEEEIKPNSQEKMEESMAIPETEPENIFDNHRSPKRCPSKSPGKSPSKSPMQSPKKSTPTSSLAKSDIQTKNSKDIEDIDMNSEKVTIESEEETLTISQPSNVGSGDGAEMGWNQLSEIIGDKSSTESPSVASPQSQEVEKKPAKRRGRPRKYPLPADVSGNGDSSTKFEEPQVLPGTPDSQETDRKTSESDGERSYTGRRRKPNKKYLESDIYSSSPGRRTPRTDDSQSETEEKEHKIKGRRGRKPSAISKAIRKSLEEYEFSDQTLDSAEEVGVSTPITKSPIVKSPEFTAVKPDAMSPINITDLLATSDVEIKSQGFGSLETDRELIVETKAKTGDTKVAEVHEMEEEKKIEMLPPKKSQIKKFEMSLIDAQEAVVKPGNEPEKTEPEGDSVQEEVKPEVSNEIVQKETVSQVITAGVQMKSKTPDKSVENIVEETIENIIIEEVIETKETVVESIGREPEQEVVEAIEVNIPVSTEDSQPVEAPEQVLGQVVGKMKAPQEAKASEEIKAPEESKISEKSTESEIHPTLNIEEKILSEPIASDVPSTSEKSSNDTSIIVSQESIPSALPEASDSIPVSEEPPPLKKSPAKLLPTPADVSVPVKKREKPRIIENVTLREPMQILKSKLLEKQPSKCIKHKLEVDDSSKNVSGSTPRAKIIKLESNKLNTSPKTSPGLTISKKLQVLKADETRDFQQDKLNLSNTISIASSATTDPSEVEFDINSIPFVMSEDLTPENVEQMPVMMSSIISAPSSSPSITPALALTTPTTQMTTNQVHFKPTMTAIEPSTSEKAPAKKKTASPTILKTKTKAKPTITSIKTLVPPLTGGVKGLKFQNQQGTKTMGMLASPKGSPGKYVIVQAGSGGQPVRYTVQGTTAIPQKMPISSAKTTTGNPQIVRRGNKVVILTSPTSGQSKMVPLAVENTLTAGKVQKIMTNKGQVVGKTIIAPKSDTSSPTTSKITPSGQKIVNTGVLSKNVFTPISGAKTVLGTIPQHFITQKGVITQINASQISGKTVMAQKTYVTNKGTLYPISTQGGKTLLTPISQSSLPGKTIITSPGLVPGKGAVLTPFTGQQVKAMVAKGTPGKSPKVQYQTVQQKVQMPMLQKKVPLSSAATMQRVGAIKSPGTIILQNPPPLHQTTPQTPGKMTPKKIIRQTVMSPLPLQPGKSQTQGVSRSKSTMTPITPQKGKQTKQKIVIQKVSPETPSKGITGQKTTVSTPGGVPGVNKVVRGQSALKNIQKQLSTPMMPASPVVPTAVVSESLSEDKKSASESLKIEAKSVEASTSATPAEPMKQEEPKIPAQPQIMALPTESADGSQTYVLVTIDEQGQIQPLDNNALMSLEGTTANADGSRTLYIDPSSLDPSGAIDNIVLQFDNTSVPALTQANPPEVTQTITEGFQTSNQDILAAALANTDFQQEIGLPETTVSSVMTAGITQTSLDTQTILQSTLIPSTEPISSPSVLETSLTLNQPIMTPLEVPSSVGIQSDITDAAPVSSMASLKIPMSIDNANISYIATPEGVLPGNSMPDIGELIEQPVSTEVQSQPASQYLVIPDLQDGIERQESTDETPTCTISYAVSIPESVVLDSGHVQTTPSMPIIDDSFVDGVDFSEVSTETSTSQQLPRDTQEEVPQIPQDENKVPEEVEPTQEIIRDMPIVQIDATTDHTCSENIPKDDAENSSKISSCLEEEASASPELKSPRVDVESSSAFDVATPKEEDSSSKIEDQSEPMETETIPEVQVSPLVAQSSQPEPMDIDFEKTEAGSQDTVDGVEAPSQSFEKFERLSINNDEVISQSTSKSEGTEATQSSPYESMEMETTLASEPPTQSFEDVRGGSAVSVSQSSCEGSTEGTNAPSQSFNEIRTADETADDPSFPTQSYEVGNADNLVASLAIDGEISQEGNIPSQSNDVGNEGIGTSGFSNNSGLNEDETASSSYVPETPETQERDQDQESAISTSSYEIPPCEEINIASSSVIADTSVDTGSLHDNGVPEIPTSSYNLNPDSSSTHVDAVPTSSFEDQVVVEQNVSTSYEVPISMPRLEGETAQNFVSESSDQRNEPSSYYARNPEEVTSEPSQSYFMPEGSSPSYPTETVSPSCYDAPPETEASQSYYLTQEIDRTEQSSSRNVEASPSFYQDTPDEVRLRSQGEATPTYTERYPLDYTLENSPIERHDLVESSVPATKPAER
ncbi:mucin-2-like [Diachasmimorpha longicaudata]|uniref:mucin-2-like n=1 Tax=Diachasmimorpha longicaudata TaxID=58733 RepID=UPI0030B894B2